MNDLTNFVSSVNEFASSAAVALVPAIPECGLGPEVRLGPDTMDLRGFLDLASKLGGSVLYMDATPFDPDNDECEVDDPPTHLVKRSGQIGRLSVAFATNGVVHFWRHRTQWYTEWQQLSEEDESPRGGLYPKDDRDGLSDEERGKLITEWTETLLNNPEFRASRGSARQRVARLAMPSDDRAGISWHAISAASDRADELARLQYDELTERLDELAAELVASVEYQRNSSAPARKRVAEQFLISRADGFSGPTHVREELYARAQRLAKEGKVTGSGPF